MEAKVIELLLSKLGGPVYVGRPQGEQARLTLKIDDLDQNDVQIKIIIPNNTYSVNSSFFLGLLAPTVQLAGSKEKFKDKFSFEGPKEILAEFDGYIDRALLEKKGLLG